MATCSGSIMRLDSHSKLWPGVSFDGLKVIRFPTFFISFFYFYYIRTYVLFLRLEILSFNDFLLINEHMFEYNKYECMFFFRRQSSENMQTGFLLLYACNEKENVLRWTDKFFLWICRPFTLRLKKPTTLICRENQ